MANSLDQVRKLTTALIISGAFNVICIFIIIYTLFQTPTHKPYLELKPADIQQQLAPLAIDHSNSEVIRYFKKMPLEWLITRLHNTKLVENGYTQRDLSLAALVSFHYFDLDKALAGIPFIQQKRSIAYGKFKNNQPATLTVYPGLTDSQYQAILDFAATEKWPLTDQGLFLALKKMKTEDKDSSLVDAFLMTSEFMAIETLFNRGDVIVGKKNLLQLSLDGTWDMLKTFAEQQKKSQDLSHARRQQFLLNYIDKRSKIAAKLMLQTDYSFAVEKLDNAHIILMLELLDERNPDSERFALNLLSSPRTDDVWIMATERLYQYAGESIPESINHKTAIARFIPDYQPSLLITTPPPVTVTPQPKRTVIVSPTKIPPSITIASEKKAIEPTKTVQKAPIKQDLLYVIQEGDTLWKLSRRFHVAINELKSYNHLSSDVLRPGKSIKIPAKTN